MHLNTLQTFKIVIDVHSASKDTTTLGKPRRVNQFNQKFGSQQTSTFDMNAQTMSAGNVPFYIC